MEQVYEHFRSNEGLTSDRLALETLYGGKFASSTQLIQPYYNMNYVRSFFETVYLEITAGESFAPRCLFLKLYRTVYGVRN